MLGSVICQRLAEQGQPVRALVRPTSAPARLARLEQPGVELAWGDLKDPASLKEVCSGARVVISTATSALSRQPGDSIQTVDLEGQQALIQAAREAGVEHFIFVSFAPLQVSFPLQDAKRAVEQSLMRSGMPFTILRPTHFMEVWLSPAMGFDYVHARARIFGTGQSTMNWISLEDVARFAVGALTSARARNALLELGGKESLSQLDVVREFEAYGGPKFQLDSIPEQELRRQFTEAREPLLRSFAGLMLSTALGSRLDPWPALQAIPLEPRTVHDYVRRVMGRPGALSMSAQ
jgi:NADH dehydrogenase